MLGCPPPPPECQNCWTVAQTTNAVVLKVLRLVIGDACRTIGVPHTMLKDGRLVAATRHDATLRQARPSAGNRCPPACSRFGKLFSSLEQVPPTRGRHTLLANPVAVSQTIVKKPRIVASVAPPSMFGTRRESCTARVTEPEISGPQVAA